MLVSCSHDAADKVLAAFHKHGHMSAAVIGEVRTGAPMIAVG
ncbi:hypothetical protein [Hyphococcus sp.]